MNKMQMAQDYIIAEVRRVGVCSIDEDKIADAWKIADAMQAEAEKHEDKTRPEVLEEWQPDWSQAPDGYNWWAADQCGCYWYDREPKWMDNEWGGYTINKNNRSVAKQTSSLGYIGNWKNSLRKRPQ